MLTFQSAVADQVQGSDRGRIQELWYEQKSRQHPAWRLIEATEQREYGYHALSDLAVLWFAMVGR